MDNLFLKGTDVAGPSTTAIGRRSLAINSANSVSISLARAGGRFLLVTTEASVTCFFVGVLDTGEKLLRTFPAVSFGHD